MTNEAQKFVSLGGECFRLEFKGEMKDDRRDGIVYKFRVTDLSKRNRGSRLVSVFSFGPYAELPNYAERIEIVRLNRIRRAFDSGELDFDAPHDEQHYKELALETSDFEDRRPNATDVQICQFIKNAAYWLGF